MEGRRKGSGGWCVFASQIRKKFWAPSDALAAAPYFLLSAASCTPCLFSLSLSLFLSFSPFPRVLQSPPVSSMRAVLRSQPSWPVRSIAFVHAPCRSLLRGPCVVRVIPSLAAFPGSSRARIRLKPGTASCACVTGCITPRRLRQPLPYSANERWNSVASIWYEIFPFLLSLFFFLFIFFSSRMIGFGDTVIWMF